MFGDGRTNWGMNESSSQDKAVQIYDIVLSIYVRSRTLPLSMCTDVDVREEYLSITIALNWFNVAVNDRVINEMYNKT